MHANSHGESRKQKLKRGSLLGSDSLLMKSGAGLTLIRAGDQSHGGVLTFRLKEYGLLFSRAICRIPRVVEQMDVSHGGFVDP